MNRRDFLASSIAAAGASAMGGDASAQAPSKPMPQYYELRQYHLRMTNYRLAQKHQAATWLPRSHQTGGNFAEAGLLRDLQKHLGR